MQKQIQRRLWPIVVIALACIALAPAQDFTGRVVEDSSGEPVASAELKIHKAGLRELVADLDTDRAGRFQGSDLPAGEYTIDVLKPNFITTTFPLHIPNADLQVRLLRYGVMAGRVTNIRGEAVAGIVRAPYGQTIGATRLTVLAKQPGSEEFRPVRDTSIDDEGHYRFFDLPPGQYELGMWYYGINEGSGMQLYPDNTNPRIFTIVGSEVYNDLNFLIAPTAAYKLSGTVALAAPGTKFALALGVPDQPAFPIAIALAGDDGSFHFDKVPAGTYDLFAAGPTGGYGAFDSVLNDKAEPLFARMRIQVAGSDMTGIAVTVAPARSLDVVLRPHNGKDFPTGCPQSASVDFASVDPWGVRLNATAQVSFAKEQTIPRLAPGRYRITAGGLGADCYQANEKLVDLSKDVPQPFVIEVEAAGSIHGKLHAGAPCTVVLLDAANTESAQTQQAVSDTEGHFSFENLHPGRYRIMAQPVTKPADPAAGEHWIADVNVAGGEATSLELGEPQ